MRIMIQVKIQRVPRSYYNCPDLVHTNRTIKTQLDRHINNNLRFPPTSKLFLTSDLIQFFNAVHTYAISILVMLQLQRRI
jgi:hypothetical protein